MIWRYSFDFSLQIAYNHDTVITYWRRHLVYLIKWRLQCSEIPIHLQPIKQDILANVGLTLAQRQKRWANVKLTLFAGALCWGSWHWPLRRTTYSSVITQCHKSHWSNVGSMLGQRLRRWSSIDPNCVNVPWWLNVIHFSCTSNQRVMHCCIAS